jgi:hypothetical protein
VGAADHPAGDALVADGARRAAEGGRELAVVLGQLPALDGRQRGQGLLAAGVGDGRGDDAQGDESDEELGDDGHGTIPTITV